MLVLISSIINPFVSFRFSYEETYLPIFRANYVQIELHNILFPYFIYLLLNQRLLINYLVK